ncbi:hypothetical protein IV102_23340, partial [bacterium]|nr:hypothetical protein [bacterium]
MTISPARTGPSPLPPARPEAAQAGTPQDSFVAATMLPQDPMITAPETVMLPREQMGTQLSGPRLHTKDSIVVAKADSQGNYLVDPQTPQFDQVNTYSVVAGTLLTYEKNLGHSIPWSFQGPLEVHPHAGDGKTAYYSRWDESINFCQWDSPSLGKTVKTSQSFDVASHETGHAILDGLRPGLLAGRESKAFHEGFGDSSAILHALQYDSNLEKILAENGGDFSRPSLVTRLAEEFGTAFNKEDDNPNNDDHPYYRTALNQFKYQDPNTLPSDSYPPSQPEEVLTNEPHSFSRIWSGAFYSMLGALYDQAALATNTPLDALKTARDALGKLWGRSLDQLPAANLKFRQPALAIMREANRLEQGRYFDSLAQVMLDRNLLTQEQIDQARQGPSGLRLSSQVANAEQAQHALETLAPQLGLDGKTWQADAPLAGSNGRQVLTFREPRSVDLDLGALGPARMQLDSGLTLVFDEHRQLLDLAYTPVTRQDVQAARVQAREIADLGRIALPGFAPSGSSHQARLRLEREGPPVFELI